MSYSASDFVDDVMGHVAGFSHVDTTAGLVLRQLRRGMMDRINRHDRTRIGRRYDDHFYRLLRDAARLRNIHRRIRVYQFETDEVRRRFGHLLASHED